MDGLENSFIISMVVAGKISAAGTTIPSEKKCIVAVLPRQGKISLPFYIVNNFSCDMASVAP
jgi:hypothetical protein